MMLNKQVGVLLNQVHFLFKQCFSVQLARNDIHLTPEQFLVMDTLWDNGALSQQEIANKMKKDKNSITKLVDVLERKEYVVRIHDTVDRRKNIVETTRKGAQLKRRVSRIAVKSVDAILDGIPEADRTHFVAVLNQLQANMRKLLIQE